LVKQISLITPMTVSLEMVSASAEPGIKPLEALTEILGLTQDRSLGTRILKTSWQPITEQ